jgi:predicted alpha/beta superfamily hydrolase
VLTPILFLALLAQQVPLSIGDTFTIESKVLGETRRINVYRPSPYGLATDAPLPVMYMPDGGIQEDFLHVAGLVQVLSGNGAIRPFLLVGIENTERRRDMTGPTSNAEDRKIAPRVGGSEAFRRFIRDELMPAVKARYRTTAETAIVGESLAGLFVVETLLLAPDMFDTYIAFDPSLWWNDAKLIESAEARLAAGAMKGRRLYVAVSGDGDRADAIARFGRVLRERRTPGHEFQLVPMPDETHATIYHPAALRAFRLLFKPPA